MKISLSFLCLFFIGNLYAQAIYDRNARFHPSVAPESKGMVVSQEQIASEVGAKILARGGNAVDAAVATGFALSVTFPQAGNLGGGGFMLVYLADANEVFALDYREIATLSATRDMYLNVDGSVDIQKKRFSVDSVAVPGTVAGLLYAQEKWGQLSRKAVLEPAIKLAKEGFVVSDSLAYSLNRAADRFQTEQTRAYFLGESGTGHKPASLWIQADLAKTLTRISKKGVAGFYQGQTADMLVNQVAELGGSLSHQDLLAYKPMVRDPVIGHYRGYQVASMPPPSSGGIHLIQMLNILENTDFEQLEHNSSPYIHLLVEAMKPAYADRSLHLGDPDFVAIPSEKLLSKDYAKQIWSQIDTQKARTASDILPTNFQTEESSDTTHYSVWDAQGNVVSNTYTLNFSYGNGIAVAGAGFLLNNEMDDFSAKSGASNAYGLVGGKANSIEPGKRPLSSMTPTILMKDSKPFMVTGSPGGSRIITSVLQSILNVVEFDLNAAETVSLPRFHHQWRPDKIFWEEGISLDTREALESKGHRFAERPRNFAKLAVILKTDTGLQGAADPRWPGSYVAVQPE